MQAARRVLGTVKELVAAAANRYTLNEHGPVHVADQVVCDGHPERTSWPCRQWRRAAAQQAVRRSSTSQ